MINLSKNQVIDLRKEDSTGKLDEIKIGMGWHVNTGSFTRKITKEVPVGGIKNLVRGIFNKPQEMETREIDYHVRASSYEYDLDVSCAITTGSRFDAGNALVYYAHKHEPGISHGGDNLTGSTGKKDDEVITIKLNKVHGDHVVVFMNIYQASDRDQTFASMTSAYVRICNMTTDEELCRYDLTQLDFKSTALVVGILYKETGEWLFKAIGECFKADDPRLALTKICNMSL